MASHRLASRLRTLAGVLGAAPALLFCSAATAADHERAYDFSAISARLDQECAAGFFSGVLLVRAAGETIFERECGQADIVNAIDNRRETRFKIYSTSKFITALTVMKLVELHQMELDAPVSAYIPDAPAEWSHVTIRQLLNHTSGILDLTERLIYFFRADATTAMRQMLPELSAGERALASGPGEAFAYNNFGFELLADAAAHAGGRPFTDLVRTYVFEPAHMATASIEQPNMLAGHPLSVAEPGLAIGYNGAPGALEPATNFAFIQLGAGAIRASVDDFVALDEALKAGGILSAQSLQAMMAEPLGSPPPRPGAAPSPTPASAAPAPVAGFGLGVIVTRYGDTTFHGHTGGTNGYISDFERYPEDDAMMIALTNRGFVKTGWLRTGVADVLKAARH